MSKEFETEKPADQPQPPTCRPRPQPTAKPQQLGSPKRIQASTSESEFEDDVPVPSRLSKPPMGRLVVSYENFKFITEQLNKIHALVRRLLQVIQNHDAIAEALNNGSTPPTFNILQQLSKPPQY